MFSIEFFFQFFFALWDCSKIPAASPLTAAAGSQPQLGVRYLLQILKPISTQEVFILILRMSGRRDINVPNTIEMVMAPVNFDSSNVRGARGGEIRISDPDDEITEFDENNHQRFSSQAQVYGRPVTVKQFDYFFSIHVQVKHFYHLLAFEVYRIFLEKLSGISLGLFFRGGGGQKCSPSPTNILTRRRRKIFGVYWKKHLITPPPPQKKKKTTKQKQRFYQLLFDRQNTGVFVLCKECVFFFLTYLDLLLQKQ